MSFLVPSPTSDRTTVTASSQQFSFTMVAGQIYVVTASVAAYLAQGSNPTASAADGSTYIAAGESVVITGNFGAKLAIIRAGAADGEATMTLASLTNAGR